MNAPLPEVWQVILDKARRTIDAARHALAGGFYEDAASRAYYAAFHGMTVLLLTENVQVTKHGQALGVQ